MKANEVLDWLIAYSGGNLENTVDTIKAGSDRKETKKVAFCFIPTPAVIRAAHAWGADVLVTHEPTYHNHLDEFIENPVTLAKKNLVDRTGMTIYRWHDHAHLAKPDVIADGIIRTAGLEGDYSKPYIILDRDTDAVELSSLIEEKMGVRHVRIVGNRLSKVKKVFISPGAPSDNSFYRFLTDDSDLMIVGEGIEWKHAYPIFDAAELGFNKSLLLLGHCGSERDGMMLICDKWNEAHPDVEGKYFECGELYSYTD